MHPFTVVEQLGVIEDRASRLIAKPEVTVMDESEIAASPYHVDPKLPRGLIAARNFAVSQTNDNLPGVAFKGAGDETRNGLPVQGWCVPDFS